MFVYILAVVLIGLPLLFNEMALGRHSGKNPVGAIWQSGGKSFWVLGGILSISVSFFVMSYYGVIAGWTIGYIYTSLADVKMDFTTFIAQPAWSIALFALFLLISVLIVQGGISKGIEKASKVLMPVLFVLVVLIILRSVTLDGAMEGVAYYLTPDFSKINGGVVLSAIGQAFFSMSVGWGILITYGSYLKKSENIVTAGIWVAFTDTAVALMGGLMIFPAVFAFGKAPNQGTALAFQVLPEVFDALPFGGNVIGAFFFLLLCIAALTSAIAIIEVPVSYLMDEKRLSRKRASWMVTIGIFLVGIPSALSSGGMAFFTDMQITLFGNTLTGFLNIMDYIFGTFIIVLAALMVCLYTGWVYQSSRMVAELGQGCTWFTKPVLGEVSPAVVWLFFIRYICPSVIVVVLLEMVGLFNF